MLNVRTDKCTRSRRRDLKLPLFSVEQSKTTGDNRQRTQLVVQSLRASHLRMCFGFRNVLADSTKTSVATSAHSLMRNTTELRGAAAVPLLTHCSSQRRSCRAGQVFHYLNRDSAMTHWDIVLQNKQTPARLGVTTIRPSGPEDVEIRLIKRAQLNPKWGMTSGKGMSDFRLQT